MLHLSRWPSGLCKAARRAGLKCVYATFRCSGKTALFIFCNRPPFPLSLSPTWDSSNPNLNLEKQYLTVPSDLNNLFRVSILNSLLSRPRYQTTSLGTWMVRDLESLSEQGHRQNTAKPIQRGQEESLQEMVLEQPAPTCKRMTLDLNLTPCSRISSKWITDLNVTDKTIKLKLLNS